MSVCVCAIVPSLVGRRIHLLYYSSFNFTDLITAMFNSHSGTGHMILKLRKERVNLQIVQHY